MPRPERPLYPELDPLHAFAQRLRHARAAAGNPTYEAMSRRTNRSRTALSEAAGGDRLPRWETVDAYVSFCGHDPAEFLLDWERARDLRDGTVEPVPGNELAHLSNLPRRPGRIFHGRTDALTAVHGRLDAAGPGGGLALYGLGGVGKTELVLQYIDRNRSRYGPIWWVTADTEENLTYGLAEFTRAVQPDWAESAGTAATRAWAMRWLASHDGWLLVLDNVVDPQTVAMVLANAVRGHIIVTSRRDLDWRVLDLTPLRLEVLSRRDSVDLLIARSGRVDEKTDAVRLAADLADLPLALTHAGAYLAERRHVTIAEYRRRLIEQPGAVLGARALAHPADDPVARTWLITIDAIRADSPLAVALLDAIAYLAPGAIPVHLLIGPGLDPIAVEDALAVAVSYSLITRSGAEIGVHRLVQAAIRASHTGNAPCIVTMDLLLAAVPPGGPVAAVSTWPMWAQLVAHIEALAMLLRTDPALAADAGLAERAVRLLGPCALYLREQGRYESAVALLRQRADMLHRSLGPEHPDTVTARYWLAGGLWSAGHFPQALQLGTSTWYTRRRLLGVDHPDTLANASYVALGHRELGRHDDALALTVETVAAQERVLGADHPDTLQTRNNLAGCYRAVGRHHDALALYESAFNDRTRVLGADHPDTLQSRHNLAGGTLATGRVSEAIALYESTLERRIAVLGPEHPDTLHTQHLLATCFASVGRTAEAVELHERTARRRRRRLGPTHPDTLKSEIALTELRAGRTEHENSSGRP